MYQRLIMKRTSLLLVILLALCTPRVSAQTDIKIRLLPQVAFGGYNTVAMPNLANDRFSLSNEFDQNRIGTFSPRMEVELVYRRNHFILTGSLLRKLYSTTLARPISYGGVEFETGSSVDAIYRFNTYRFTYRYGVVDRPKFSLELGATILVRDALISLDSHSKANSLYDLGVVPLISYSIAWKPTPKVSIMSYGDAMALKIGRAEDIFVGVEYNFAPHVTGIAGYRLLEGGGGPDKVYTFALFHFATLGVQIDF